MKTSNKVNGGGQADETTAAPAADQSGTDAKSDKQAKKPAKKAKAVKKTATKAKPAKKVARKTTTPKKATPKAAKKAKKDVRTADNSNRDFGRYRFGGEDLPKGRVVLAVITEDAKKKGMTLGKLQERWPDELMRGPWGTVKELSAAKRLGGSQKLRYFQRDAHVISVGGKKVVVCNQWSSEGFKEFLKHAKSHGYSIAAARK